MTIHPDRQKLIDSTAAAPPASAAASPAAAMPTAVNALPVATRAEEAHQVQQQRPQPVVFLQPVELSPGNKIDPVPGVAAALCARLLHKMAVARPGSSWEEVALAVREDLRGEMMRDVMEGDPRGGIPPSVAELEILEERLEKLRGEVEVVE